MRIDRSSQLRVRDDGAGFAPLPEAALPSPLLTRTLLACIAVVVAMTGARLAGLVVVIGTNAPGDFHVFHLVGRMIWAGRLDQAYHAATMLPLERQLSGEDIFLPWTYPPPFDLVVAPLGLLPLWLAYLIFTGATLGLYLVVLRAIAGRAFGAVALALFPAICMGINCGQNGFLTGSLAGLACIGLLRGGAAGSWAGIPLGLMAIKPHLAGCLALYALASRRWTVAAVAACVVALAAGLSTLAFGPSIWTHFLHGIDESRLFLERGLYPLYRMVSSYAVLRTLGAPAFVAMAFQAAVAALAVCAVLVAIRSRMPRAHALGIAALTTLLVSPYVYDYDLPIYGIGLALLMPELLRLTSACERILLLGLSWSAGGWGIAQSLVVEARYGNALPPDTLPLSLGGVALVVLTALVWRILRRERSAARGSRPARLAGAAA